jgi:hypothetical protein
MDSTLNDSRAGNSGSDVSLSSRTHASIQADRHREQGRQSLRETSVIDVIVPDGQHGAVGSSMTRHSSEMSGGPVVFSGMSDREPEGYGQPAVPSSTTRDRRQSTPEVPTVAVSSVASPGIAAFLAGKFYPYALRSKPRLTVFLSLSHRQHDGRANCADGRSVPPVIPPWNHSPPRKSCGVERGCPRPYSHHDFRYLEYRRSPLRHGHARRQHPSMGVSPHNFCRLPTTLLVLWHIPRPPKQPILHVCKGTSFVEPTLLHPTHCRPDDFLLWRTANDCSRANQSPSR